MTCRHNQPIENCACSHDLVFTVQVCVSSHDRLKEGITCAGDVTYQILAQTDTQATLMAAQITAGIYGMPTRTTVLDCVA